MPSSIVVVPCYNEAARLDVDTFVAFAQSHADVRLLFVDDGSSDGTSAVLARMATTVPERIQWFALPHNQGKAEAVRQGFLRAFAASPPPDFVGFWDADLATPIGDVVAFAALLVVKPRLLAVIGARVNLLGRSVTRNLARHYVGRVFATVVDALLRLPIYDTQCGAKLLRATDDVQSVFADRFVSRWIFDVELIVRLRQRLRAVGQLTLADVMYEHPLLVWRDIAGSKLRLRHFAIVFGDVLRIWWRSLRGRT